MHLPPSFELQPTSRSVFGRGVLSKLGRRARSLGVRKALVVTDPGLVTAGWLERVTSALGAESIEVRGFAEVEPNPRAATVDRGAAQLRDFPDAWVVAVGGGSVLDAAKAIALAGANAVSIRELGFGSRPEHSARPCIAIPTTAGTGSETNPFSVITDPELGRKVLVGHPSMLPVLTLLDPELTVGLPRGVTAATGMDALTHAIEALSSARRNPASEALALQAIRLVSQNLRGAVADGAQLPGREAMLTASHLAGLAFSSAGLGLCHAMGHPLSARLDTAHGQALATLLPHVVEYHLDQCGEVFALAADAFDVGRGASAEAKGQGLLAAIRALSQDVGTALSARELGVSEELIPTLAEDALGDPLILTTPKPTSSDAIARLYRDALG